MKLKILDIIFLLIMLLGIVSSISIGTVASLEGHIGMFFYSLIITGLSLFNICYKFYKFGREDMLDKCIEVANQVIEDV